MTPGLTICAPAGLLCLRSSILLQRIVRMLWESGMGIMKMP